LTPEEFVAKAESLPLPNSVIEYFQGALGPPPGGFPEPLRSKVLKGRSLEDGRAAYDGRPGATMKPYDFDKELGLLQASYPSNKGERDALSYALYPQVFRDWQEHRAVYGEVEALPTEAFLHPMAVGDEVEFATEPGRSWIVKLVSVPKPDENGQTQVIMELNGERWFVPVTDNSVQSATAREKAGGSPGSVGSPMPGVVVDVKVKPGDTIREGEPLVVLSAMKMETAIPAPASGVVERLLVSAGDKVEGDDLLAQIGEGAPKEEGGGSAKGGLFSSLFKGSGE
jgi:pyruvate carboxylase